MEKDTVVALRQPGEFEDLLTDVLRQGALKLLAQAVEAEVADFLTAYADLVTEDGRQRLVRHGHLPERTIQTGIGSVEVRQPRVRDRGSEGEKIRFSPAILPPYARRPKSLDALIPILYLRRISSGDFQEALSALLGKEAPNLSPAVLGRLKGQWKQEFERWQPNRLSRECPVMERAAADLKSRGLSVASELAIGDGALGFWKALEQEFGTTRHQRCWVHKVLNILNKLPKSVQSRAKADLKEIWMAEGRDDAEKAFDRFLAKYQAKYDKAADCLAKDRETLLAFYDFPAEHWKHIRTGNPIESTFATVRHRTVRAKGCLSYETAKIMVFKMIQAAQKSWRKLDGQNQLPKVIEGIKFTDGIETVRDHAAA